jgi:hypothetical protein
MLPAGLRLEGYPPSEIQELMPSRICFSLSHSRSHSSSSGERILGISGKRRLRFLVFIPQSPVGLAFRTRVEVQHLGYAGRAQTPFEAIAA